MNKQNEDNINLFKRSIESTIRAIADNKELVVTYGEKKIEEKEEITAEKTMLIVTHRWCPPKTVFIFSAKKSISCHPKLLQFRQIYFGNTVISD